MNRTRAIELAMMCIQTQIESLEYRDLLTVSGTKKWYFKDDGSHETRDVKKELRANIKELKEAKALLKKEK